jgi:hypothetical protein
MTPPNLFTSLIDVLGEAHMTLWHPLTYFRRLDTGRLDTVIVVYYL